ncbi:MAG: HAD family hydrolase, partial [Pseudomonadota bacterium]
TVGLIAKPKCLFFDPTLGSKYCFRSQIKRASPAKTNHNTNLIVSKFSFVKTAKAKGTLKTINERMEKSTSSRYGQRIFSKNGLNGVYRHYSWPAHVKKYLKEIRRVLNKDRKRLRRQQVSILNSERTSIPLAKMALICDIDNTLLGERASQNKVMDWIFCHQQDVAFAVATGRTIESTVSILNKHQVKIPDVMITSVGAEIYYGKKLVPDIGWSAHIRHLWRRDCLVDAFLKFPGISLQPDNTQREFKLSYFAKPGQIPSINEIYDYLHTLKLYANIIYSHGEFLDILPIRASKGHAIRYLAYKWDLP